MEFEEDQEEEHEEEEDEEMSTQLPTSYDSLVNNNNNINNSARGGFNKILTTTPPSEPLLSSDSLLRKPPKYRECLKNHAVGMGGHAVDGCGEFLPAGEEGTLDALKCAACNCHRNFHRKETEPTTIKPGGGGEVYFHHLHHQQVPQFTPYYRTPTGYLHLAATAAHHQRPLALPSTSGGGGSREDQEDMSNLGSGSSRKRFRTKFTMEQKDKMLGLAEKLGWRIQKHDEEIVQQFCDESGVKRHVLKVWMHNNKHTLGKKP